VLDAEPKWIFPGGYESTLLLQVHFQTDVRPILERAGEHWDWLGSTQGFFRYGTLGPIPFSHS
jgi:hypothetical protein